MPIYMWICGCGAEYETGKLGEAPYCQKCGTPMKRNWKGESACNTFHPTRDLYAEKNLQAQKKNGVA